LSQFAFLQREWPEVLDAATRAEAAVHADPRTGCFYARRALEMAVAWAYKHDAALKLPYQDNLSALIHEPSFKQAAGEAVFSKARVINTLASWTIKAMRRGAATPQGNLPPPMAAPGQTKRCAARSQSCCIARPGR
jgi:type I restriction enzyme R subunit